MTPRAQELYDIAALRTRKEARHKNTAGLQFRIAEILAEGLAAMEHDLSSGFIREHLVPGSIDAARKGEQSNAN